MYSLGLSSGMMMMVMMIFGSVILDLLQAAGTRRLGTRTGTGPAQKTLYEFPARCSIKED